MQRRFSALAAAAAIVSAACTEWSAPTLPHRRDLGPPSADVSAGQVTYQYTGNHFTSFCSGLFGSTEVCNSTGEGTSYSPSDFATATITLDTPLLPNLLLEDITAYPGFHLVMSDGHQTLTSAPGAIVSTDADGQIVRPWFVRTNGPVPPNNGIGIVNWPDVRGVGDLVGLTVPTGLTLDTPFDAANNSGSPGTWTMLSTNHPPAASSGGPYSAQEGTAITFDGRGSSDLDGNTITFDWNFGDGSAHGSGATPSHAYADNGNYPVTLTVSDDNGGSSSATTTATITNVAPVVNAGGNTILLIGEAFAGVGSFTDPGADSWTATVDFNDGSGVQPFSLTGKSFELHHTYGAAGTYHIVVTISDDDGGISTGDATIVVQTFAQAAQSLSQAVSELGSALPLGQQARLTGILQGALNALARGNTTAANAQLQQFVREVDALVSAGRLPADAGLVLTSAANRIIRGLS
jgi:hypothetical protein